MHGLDLIRDLERRFLPRLRSAGAEIGAAFPEVRVQGWSQTHGQKTDSPGHVIGLSCVFLRARADQPDEVVLELCFGDVFGAAPTVDVDVIWGHPGQLELDLFPGKVTLSSQALDTIEAALPRLVEALRVAVRRGRPDAPSGGASPPLTNG
jgi:hypothetical protein